MSAHRILGLALVGLLGVAAIGCSADTESDDSAPASQGAATTGAKLVVDEDSDVDGTFIYDFIERFRELAKKDTKDGMRGASSSDELDQGVLKVQRKGGKIECNVEDKMSCTFTFDAPADKDLGVPVVRGNNNSLAGQLDSWFESHAVVLAGVGAGGEAVSARYIGEKDKGPYIECTDDGFDRGFALSKCAFHLAKKKK